MDSASFVALSHFLHEVRLTTDFVNDQPHGQGHLFPKTDQTSESMNAPDEIGDDPIERRRRIRLTQAARRRQRYIVKRRKEREMLRQEVVELSATLNQLKERKALSVALVANNSSLAAWKAVAVRQKECRLQAEANQSRLGAHVAHQSQLIRNLNSLLNQSGRLHSTLE